MAAKVTIADLKNTGFRKEQFGFSSDASGFDTVLTGIVDEVGRWAAARVGATAYAAAAGPSVEFDRLKYAEQYKAQGELWRRRAVFLDTNATQGLDLSAAAERRECYLSAERCDALAAEWLDLAVTGDPAAVTGSGLAVGLTESGMFSPLVDGAVTA